MDSDLEKAIADLVEKAKSIDVTISASQAQKLARFIAALIDYNAHTNLVSSSDPGTIAVDHVLDSLTLLPVIKIVQKQWPARMIDIGTGAGFPGIVLAVMEEQLMLTLVDATAKKTKFVKEQVQSLQLSNVEVITARAEDLAHKSSQRQKYALATGRAVGSADVTMELAVPFLALNGSLLLQKSQAQKEAELGHIKACAGTLGCQMERCIDLPENLRVRPRLIIVVAKKFPTDPSYPRPWSKIKAQPLSYKEAPSASGTNHPSAEA